MTAAQSLSSPTSCAELTPMPTFIIIGAGKGGTTSLYQYLRQHPNIFMPEKKELHYFVHQEPGTKSPRTDGTQILFDPVASMEEYRHWFEGARPGMAKGEASPMYLYFESAAQRIKKQLPDVKLICILRDPSERAYSAYVHFVRDGLETLSFPEALAAEPGRIREGKSVGYRYRSMGFYGKQLKPYFSSFGKKQIKVVLYEDFCNDPKAVMEELFKFIGVDERFVPDMSIRFNKSGIPKSQRLHRFFETGIHSSRLFRILKRPIPNGLYRRAVLFLKNRNLVKPELPTSERRALIDGYKPDILECQDLLGRNLSNWLQ